MLKNIEDNSIGFKLSDNKKLELIFPEFINKEAFNSEFNENEKFQFYNLFKKYQRDYNKQNSIKNKDNFNINSSFSNGNRLEFSLIESYFSLLEDYKSNGLFLFNEIKTNLKPLGNVNWGFIINKSNPIINDENVIYNKLYFKNLNFNYNHPLTILYACALLLISDKLNIKVNINYDFKYLRQLINSPINIQSILRKYKKDMFSDRQKRIFSILESIFLYNKLKNNLSKNGENLYFVYKFDMIWEKMLEISLFDQYNDFINKIPTGKYFLTNDTDEKNVESSGITPKPDIIISHIYNGKKYLLVLDAKNYITENSLPKTGDINKQINYRFFLSKNFDKQNEFELENIVNAFLFPSDSPNDKPIEYIGKHSFIGNYKNNSLGLILCFKINFFELRKNYINPNKEYQKKILDYILSEYLLITP